MAAAGYSIAPLDIQSCAATLASVKAVGADAVEFLGDLCDKAVVARAVETARERWRRADVLVNNAGISHIEPAEKTKAAASAAILEVNLREPFLLATVLGAIMLEQRSGSIINVSSTAGPVGISDRSACNASKRGLIGLTRTLAAEWGGRGICTNAVCPGWVKTEMDAADQDGGS